MVVVEVFLYSLAATIGLVSVIFLLFAALGIYTSAIRNRTSKEAIESHDKPID